MIKEFWQNTKANITDREFWKMIAQLSVMFGIALAALLFVIVLWIHGCKTTFGVHP